MMTKLPHWISPASLLAAALALTATGCDKSADTASPEQDDDVSVATSDNTLVTSVASADNSGDEGLSGSLDDVTLPELQRAKLPKRQEPKEVCKGKGKKRECKLTDPTPGVSAAYGVRSMMGDYGWGFNERQVFKLMVQGIDAAYDKARAETSDAMAQDKLRNERQASIRELESGHVKFRSALKHKWAASAVAHEFEDDREEEMLWQRESAQLSKYYFFKDGELYKVVFAFTANKWPGKDYAAVKAEAFDKWFGVSGETKIKFDDKNEKVLAKYDEWKSNDGDVVRVFDMSSVHGVYLVEVIDGKTEERLGTRLPKGVRETEKDESLSEFMGGSDVCYDSNGNISECEAAKE